MHIVPHKGFHSLKAVVLITLAVVGSSLFANHPSEFGDCPDVLEAAARGFHVTTSWGPVLSNQIAVSLMVSRENACTMRDTQKNGNCVVAAKHSTFLVLDEGDIRLSQAQIISSDQNHYYVFGVSTHASNGFVALSQRSRGFPNIRRQDSWGSSESLGRDISPDYSGQFLPVFGLEEDEQILTVKASQSLTHRHYRAPDPKEIIKPNHGDRFFVFLTTSHGRLLHGVIELAKESDNEQLEFRKLREFEPIAENRRWSPLIESLGEDLLLALTDDGVLYQLDGENVTKLTAVPGEAVALTGYSIPIDELDDKISDSRLRMKVWIAARTIPGSRAELYEFKGLGQPLVKTSYQPRDDESIASLSADAKFARVSTPTPRSKNFIPAYDHFARKVDLETNEVRTGNNHYYERLIVGIVRPGDPGKAVMVLRGLTQKNELEEIPWRDNLKRLRTRTKVVHKPSLLVRKPEPHPDPDVQALRAELYPSLDAHYEALTKFIWARRTEQDDSGEFDTLQRTPLAFYHLLQRRLALIETYRDPTGVLRLGSFEGLSRPVEILLLEAATLPTGEIGKRFLPLGVASNRKQYSDWIAMLKTPLGEFFTRGDSKDGFIRSTCSLGSRVDFVQFTERLSRLYFEDSEKMERALVRQLHGEFIDNPNIILGEALVNVMADYDPLRQFDSMEPIQTLNDSQSSEVSPESTPTTK